MDKNKDKRGAAVKFPPPLVFLVFIAMAYGLHRVVPFAIGFSPGFNYSGLAAVILGLAIILLAGLSLKRASTSIEPWKPTTQIVSSGVFAYSRNPIYIAFSLISIGIGVFLDSFWVVISCVPSSVAVYYLAIRKEERYLEKKFGEEYLAYKRKVRRWL
ncbi:isoprenylcysteine carboxylmethyltransferase family protein [Motiliproteus sp. MSK22-1]|uniref:methyltransferase family protein n=1 Tax=Motiliproteus sp. MSK22-1 TaxID=1897630 RepID=UPI0009784FD8|nr:isoprenylcysteine carboxylmethyltransferase family protein [Motiliproteus sp. MSK22-1]OMH29469.1 hypothetical protein BGP75_19685 [Motiliproteus sp. MSK22-1]